MTSGEYADQVVLPTVREFMTALGDRRLADLARITSYHLVDYVAKAEGEPNNQQIIATMRGVCGDAFDVVDGIRPILPRPMAFSRWK
jgi:hypothetical protein